MPLSIKVGARSSALSRAQVEEVYRELTEYYPGILFDPIWLSTHGDCDLVTSLRHLDKTDFFTREIDALQLQGGCRISIHSAKDLPDPLPQGLEIAALTKGVDPSDALVLRNGDLPIGAKVGTSSLRREESLRALRPDLVCVDIRGTITMRLAQLDAGAFDAVVIAEAALIRLGLTDLKRIALPGEAAPLQGKLAVVVREGDEEMKLLFACIDRRPREESLVSRNRSDAF